MFCAQKDNKILVFQSC